MHLYTLIASPASTSVRGPIILSHKVKYHGAIALCNSMMKSNTSRVYYYTCYNTSSTILFPHLVNPVITLAVKICTTIFIKCINRSGFPNKPHSILILESLIIYIPKKKCLSNVMDASQPSVKEKIYINI